MNSIFIEFGDQNSLELQFNTVTKTNICLKRKNMFDRQTDLQKERFNK